MHVIDSLAVGGAERMLIDIANATVRNGHRASVTVTRSGTVLANELDPAVLCSVLNRRKRFQLSAMREMVTLVRNSDVDVLHVHGRSSFSFVALLKLAGLIGPPIVFHDHFGSIETNSAVPTWFRMVGRYACSQYVGVYEKLATWAERAGVASHRIHVIHNALDLNRIKGAERNVVLQRAAPDAQKTGIFVAGIREDKGLHVLVEAVADCQNRQSIRIVIVGGDRDRAYADVCRAQISQLGLDEQFEFVGERNDVPSLLQQVDFAIIPSLSESGPLTLIEYLAAGVPFVATRVGAIAQQVEQLSVPEFVNPGNADELRVAIDKLLQLTPEQLNSRGVLGRDVADEFFDIEHAMQKWYQVYEQALVGNN